MASEEIVLVTGGTGLVGDAIRYILENSPEACYQKKGNEKWVFLSSKDCDLRWIFNTLFFFFFLINNDKKLSLLFLKENIMKLYFIMRVNNKGKRKRGEKKHFFFKKKKKKFQLIL